MPAQPALFSATNLLVTISNQWKYHAAGIDLGAGWRLPNYDDSGIEDYLRPLFQQQYTMSFENYPVDMHRAELADVFKPN